MWRRMTRAYRELPAGSRAFVAISTLLLTAGLAQLFLGAIMVGITGDEPTHFSRTQGWLEFGWYLPPDFLPGGEPTAAMGGPATLYSPYVYGPAFSFLAHFANTLLGNESIHSISDSASAWTIRHLTSAFLGGVAVVAVAVSVRALTESRRFALWSAVCLLAIPIWTGMSMFNPKDIPAATGYTLVTVALVLALSPTPASGRWVRPTTVAVMLASGVYLGAGTRLALWLPLLVSILTFALLVSLRWRLVSSKPDRMILFGVAVGAVVGMIMTVVVYPEAFSHPRSLLTHSLSDSSGYDWQGVTLTAGELLDETPPVWYLPAWLFASTPLLIFLLAMGGTLSALWGLVKGAFGKASTRARLAAVLTRPELPVLLVLQQALLLSVGAMVLGSTMYSGLRQHIYIVPALAILTGYGAWRLWKFLETFRPVSSHFRWIITPILLLALIIPMLEQTMLFPYNYTYINPVAGIGGVSDRWETEYQWASAREALSRLPASADPKCSAWLVNSSDPTAAVSSVDCATYGLLAPYIGAQTAPTKTPGDFVWMIGRKRSGTQPPSYCEEWDEVTRWLRGERVVMSYVLRCDRAKYEKVNADAP